MNDPFEAQVASWLRDVARPDLDELQRLVVFAEALPQRRSRRPMWFMAVAVAAAVVVVALLALAWMPRVPAPVGIPSYPIASGDPRFTKCGGTAKGVIAAFPMARASDYHAYMPAIGKAPELETAAPAFVVVFDGTHRWVTIGPLRPSPEGPQTNAPNHFDMCVWVGDVSKGDFVSYGDVDITGMRTSLPGASPIVYPPAGRAPVANCPAGQWPRTVISCDTALAVGTPATARVSKARIWLTSLSSVTAALHPAHEMGMVPDAEVWLLVFDGSSPCCPVRADTNVSPSPVVMPTRWIVAVDATGQLHGFVYYLDWTGKQVPSEFPEIPAH